MIYTLQEASFPGACVKFVCMSYLPFTNLRSHQKPRTQWNINKSQTQSVTYTPQEASVPGVYVMFVCMSDLLITNFMSHQKPRTQWDIHMLRTQSVTHTLQEASVPHKRDLLKRLYSAKETYNWETYNCQKKNDIAMTFWDASLQILFVCVTCVSRVCVNHLNVTNSMSRLKFTNNPFFPPVFQGSVSCVCESSKCHEPNESSKCHEPNESSKILELAFHLNITISM